MKKINYLLLFSVFFTSYTYGKKQNALISILEDKSSKEVNALFLNNKNLYGFFLKTSDQKQFITLFQKALYKKALYQWQEAFGGSKFSKSSTGRALLAYLFWKNKFFLTGVKKLFSIQNPKKIHRQLLLKWKQELESNMLYWVKVPQLHWNKKWSQALSSNLRSRYLAYHSYGLSSARLYNLIKFVDLKSKEGVYLQWQLALALYLENKSKQSAKVLSFLEKSGQTVIKKDLIFLTMARILYGNHFLKLAIKYYKKIPKTSIYWFVSQEEMSWSYLRSGQLESSLSILATTTNSIFYYTSLSEGLFLKSLVELKTCNYVSVAQTISKFKQLIKKRIQVLEQISINPNADVIKNWLQALTNKDNKKLIKLSVKVPFISPNDQRLSFLLYQAHSSLKESVLASSFFKSSLSKGTSLGFQSLFKTISNKLGKESQNWQNLVFLEVKRLANDELEVIKFNIAHLKVVELEMLQQVNTLAKSQKNNKKKISSKLKKQLKVFSENKESNKWKKPRRGYSKMYFNTNSEVWLDELNHYKVRLKNLCTANM